MHLFKWNVNEYDAAARLGPFGTQVSPQQPQKAQSAMVDVMDRPKSQVMKPQEAPDGYMDLCIKLGCMPVGLKETTFKQFLFDEEISLYDHTQVMNYLRAKAREVQKKNGGNTTVDWQGLRPGKDPQGYNGYYQKVVPFRVLKLVDKIHQKFPRATFHVSEIINYPDPFLGVRIGTGTTFVVAVWDEPGFSG